MARKATLSDDPNARRLALTRLALDYERQKDFAEAIGVLPHTYNAFETAQRPLHWPLANLINRRFPAVPEEWILKGEPDRLPVWLERKLIELGALDPFPPPKRDGSTPPPASAGSSIVRKTRK